MKAKNILFWITFFSIAMGLLESAVVVYLRELYYPEGFAFPLKMLNPTIALTEIYRELATLVMLVSIGVLAGRNRSEKFGYFLYSFAIWDIFYYVFLKLLLNWPESFLTWDILFLLPTTWVGPVIAPVILSLVMIGLFFVIYNLSNQEVNPKINLSEWLFLISGSLICIISFTKEYTSYVLKEYSFLEIFSLNDTLLSYAIKFVPEHFPWWIFVFGLIIILIGIIKFAYRMGIKEKVF